MFEIKAIIQTGMEWYAKKKNIKKLLLKKKKKKNVINSKEKYQVSILYGKFSKMQTVQN